MGHREGAGEDRRPEPVRCRARGHVGGLTISAASPIPAARVTARGWGWRHAGRKAWALDGLDLDIGPGERILLLGPSGAGKSTLLHGLAGVLGGADEGEQHGELLVDGRAPAHDRGRAGLVLQDPDSQVIMARVGDDVAFGAENLGVPRGEIWQRVAEALDAVGLDLPLDHPTSRLTGGQKQRLALAGVLAMRPGLILLDEPTANLDPEGVLEVRDAVARVADRTGATLVVIEHRVAVWSSVVGRVVVLEPGGGASADGGVTRVLGQRGAALAAAGVWVPGFEPTAGKRTTVPTGDVLLGTENLAIARVADQVLRTGIEFGLAAGDALAVTGPNGAGKSTLGLTLAGLLPPVAGKVLAEPVLDDGAGREPIRWRSRELLTRIGTVFQDPEHQFVAATVRDELAVGLRALKLPAAAIAQRTDELLERLRLTRLAAANPFTLSGGEKRRLSVATVLATRPRVLVLDEPTFGQDALTWRELVALLSGLLDEGRAVVAVTHDADFIAALATREVRFAAGEHEPGRLEVVR